MAKSRKLGLEVLEDRLTPATWGIPWPNPGHLTLSFVPDGTAVSNAQSALFQSLNGSAATSAWEQEILRAFQTWAVNANINIGLVADGGQVLGTSGAVQGDPRFGDSRIALASVPTNPDVADTSPFDLSGTTWGGDMVFNGAYNFGINGAGQYDLFSVALHEAGHAFGFGDQTSDPTSANYAIYSGPRSGLSSQDIAALQSLYGGPRSTDAQSNSSMASATYLSRASQAPVNADISSLTDADYYSFTTPPATSATSMMGMTTSSTTSFTVQVKAAGISLLEPSVTVYDAFGNVVGSGAATSPLNNNVTVQVNSAKPSSTYYVKITGATSSVFGIGSFQMSIQFPSSSTSTSTTTSTSTSSSTNTSFATAQLLSSIKMTSNSQGFMYTSSGNIATAGQGNYYLVTAPTLPTAGAELLTVTAASTDANLLNPAISVFDAGQNLLPATIVTNGNGTFTIQLTGVSAGAVYYIQVGALAGSCQNVGNYFLATQFNNDAATTFTQLTSSTLTQSAVVGYQSLTVGQAGLVQLNLSASVGTALVNAAVRMTIYDQNNNQVATLVAVAGQPLTTAFTFLGAGNYTIRFNASAQGGAPLPNLSCALNARRLSDPMDPVPIDPTLTGTGSAPPGISIGSSDGGTLGTLPIIDPYSNPTTSPASPTTGSLG